MTQYNFQNTILILILVVLLVLPPTMVLVLCGGLLVLNIRVFIKRSRLFTWTGSGSKYERRLHKVYVMLYPFGRHCL
jgi:hypothetical protein